MSDVTFDVAENKMEVHQKHVEPWKVTLVNTGDDTLTGGRLKRVKEYIKDEEAFCFTYGDGVANIDISELVNFHQLHGKLATVTATHPPGRYGALKISQDSLVKQFSEKTDSQNAWINAGFFVLSPVVIDRIAGDQTSWEGEPLAGLAEDGELEAFKHAGFWQPMDTLRD
jgi:glucose-1-phosphate cytidylyltransferase